MAICWGAFSTKSKKALKTGWLITAGVLALYVGVTQPRERARGIASEKATGLAAVSGGVGWEPLSLWRQTSILPHLNREAYLQKGAVGGVPVDRAVVARASLMTFSGSGSGEEGASEDRKLGLRVENESIEAQVTKQYVDHEARLRNLRAEEQQYLGILRKAANVKDTLEVSDKLNEIRGAIEERQAEFEALSKQVETVAINITLRAEADAQVFGLNWRPLYQLKIAAREGLDGLADYAASMTAFVFYLPTALLWLFTILGGAAIGWRILRWAAKALFGFPKIPATFPAI